MAELTVTIFSDFSCPYSFVTEEAFRSLRDPQVTVRHRAYELYPEPEPLGPPVPEEQVDELRFTLAAAARVGLGAPGFRPRTRKAHEASFFAREHGAEAEMRRAVFAGYWQDARDIARIDVLMELAATVGLEPDELRIALDIDRYRDDVLHDLNVAVRLQIPGTPALYLGSGSDAKVLLGAQGHAELAAALAEAKR